MKQHSIWLIPPEPVFGKLSGIIKELAGRYGGPVFSPHLTLVGGGEGTLSDFQKAAKASVQGLREITLQSDSVSFSTTYFQSVFLRARPTASLLELHTRLYKNLGLPQPVFMPHFSLYYGNNDMTIREKIASEIMLEPFSCTIKELTIIPENNDPDGWKPLATVPLTV